jgi:nondiscriminating glutamyl-tRNA synthetase
VINEKTIVRFAPSPTGELHVGNARTALFNWLFARQKGGRFILRIEDTDRERTTKNFEKNLLDDLCWLGIDWDEGPGKEGSFGPYHQTERLDIYSAYLEKLADAGKVYPCYCLEEELEAERAKLIAKRKPPRYAGVCRKLNLQERKRLENEGRRPACRFIVEDGPVEFSDMIRGAMKFDGSAIGDFIIVRSNGLPAYNFAVVIDDHLMNITHVIRGEDHLSNTASQVMLYHALGFSLPAFAHHSLILGKDRTKLSKRHGAVSVREFRNRGILPEVLLNHLSLLGNSFGEGREVCNIAEIVRIFSLEKTGKSGAVFDEDKLKWLNGVYIKKYPADKLLQLLKPFINKDSHLTESIVDSRRLISIIGAVQENLNTLAEIKDYMLLFDDEKYKLSVEARAFLNGEDALRIVELLLEFYTSEECPEENLYEWAVKKLQIITGQKGRQLFMPIRCAVTGSTRGPELEKIIAVLGKQSVIKRIEKALQIMHS